MMVDPDGELAFLAIAGFVAVKAVESMIIAGATHMFGQAVSGGQLDNLTAGSFARAAIGGVLTGGVHALSISTGALGIINGSKGLGGGLRFLAGTAATSTSASLARNIVNGDPIGKLDIQLGYLTLATDNFLVPSTRTLHNPLNIGQVAVWGGTIGTTLATGGRVGFDAMSLSPIIRGGALGKLGGSRYSARFNMIFNANKETPENILHQVALPGTDSSIRNWNDGPENQLRAGKRIAAWLHGDTATALHHEGMHNIHRALAGPITFQMIGMSDGLSSTVQQERSSLAEISAHLSELHMNYRWTWK